MAHFQYTDNARKQDEGNQPATPQIQSSYVVALTLTQKL